MQSSKAIEALPVLAANSVYQFDAKPATVKSGRRAPRTRQGRKAVLETSMNKIGSARTMGAEQVLSRRIFLALSCGAALTGCDLKNVYSENTSTSGATWVWEGSANASDADLVGLAREVVSNAPDASMNPPGVMAVAQIAWPDSVRASVGPENRWDIYIRTQSDGEARTSLVITATFFKLAGTYLLEAAPTPEAKTRLNSLIGEVVSRGGKWSLTSERGLHVLTRDGH